MLANAALAINAFMVMIEFCLAIALVGTLMPFGVLAPTRWIALKPMAYFLSCGLEMVIAFLVSLSRTVLTTIHFSSDEPTVPKDVDRHLLHDRSALLEFRSGTSRH